MLKTTLKSVLRRAYDIARFTGPPYMSHPRFVSGLASARVHPGARLIVEDCTGTGTRILLGKGVYLADQVELAASAGGSVTVGADTSLQTACLIGGDVRIGAHCLFGKYIFVSSLVHRFRDRPSWLIRDQDRAILLDSSCGVTPHSRPVVIEDDCWIGQGVVINPGVTVGRGVVIGANSVVTKDIAPYAIAAGAPSVVIGRRLDFTPPSMLDVRDDNHMPYFYRGFDLTQAALTESRPHGQITADGSACLVLSQGRRLRLTGRSPEPQTLTFQINGHAAGTANVHNAFDLSFAIPQVHTEGLLAKHTVAEVRANTAWALAAAEVAA